MGLGLGFRRNSHSQGAKSKTDDDEQWYIPYTGPYEPPREPPRRLRPRDSWGDLLEPGDDDDAALADKELQERLRDYGETASRTSSNFGDDNGKSRVRDRSFSLLSGRTTSSGAIDPNRNSVLSPRRSTMSSAQRPPVPAYIHLDGNGGVGKSPAPHIHTKETNLSNRLSLASIFAFGSSGRKHPTSSPDRSRRNSLRKSRPAMLVDGGETPVKRLHHKPDIASDDYYDSYYSTLLRTPAKNGPPEDKGRPSTSSSISRKDSVASSSAQPHPYAYPFQKSDIPESPISAPVSSTTPQDNDATRRIGFAERNQTDALALKQLKNSASTPDLRSSIASKSKINRAPSIKDRWLSAETWCDAILFPRPRFKVVGTTSGSGRIVSPPSSPLEVTSFERTTSGAIPSRVLAHSRSLVNLNAQLTIVLGEDQIIPPPPTQPPPPIIITSNTRPRPPRPKSFAADDLALINRAFSLEQVLEEGDALENQRKKWKIQAQSSLGNSRARSLARSRSKSLTQKGRKVHHHQTSIDYLAARACLGSQNLFPDIIPPRPRTSSSTHGTESTLAGGRISHSHSNSLSKTISKSSRTHTRGHSHSESWSKSGKKQVNPPAGPPLEPSTLEGALRREDTRVIRFPDPALIAIDSASTRISPIPSGSSDIHMGIAISTTPLPEETLDRESIRMPAHPYAAAGLYTRSQNNSDEHEKRHDRKGEDFSGSCPSPPARLDAAMPTLSLMSSHPYARAISPEAFVAQSRDENDIPSSDTMWAQLSPGVMREVLPHDLVYSPFIPDQTGGRNFSNDTHSVNDSVGLGEALTYTDNHRDSHDSGLGTSEKHIIQPYIPSVSPSQEWPENGTPRVHRKPVQYDATRPTYAHHYHNSIASSAEAKPSQPVPLPSSDPLLPVAAKQNRTSPSPVTTSSTPSPQLSPRSLGSVNDLDNFHDLFYQPSSLRQSTYDTIDDRPMSQSVSMSWEIANRTRRTGSGLTSLARQLSEEFEQLGRELEMDRESSQYSMGSFGMKKDSNHSRKNTEGGLQFVFEEDTVESPIQDGLETDQDTTLLIKPHFNVPEDVASYSVESIMDKTAEDEDETAVFRVGTVDAISTPPAETPDRRHSFIGLMSFANRVARDPPTSAETHLSAQPGLQPPEVTRSSYMTTSTSSRMSGLSDFPIPPKDDGHMSLLSAYFDENINHRDLQALRETPHPFSPEAGRLTFGAQAHDVRTG